MTIEQAILESLRGRSLSTLRLIEELKDQVSGEELGAALHLLRVEKKWIEKHKSTDGCKACSCMVTYVWRLTQAGREQLPEKSYFDAPVNS